MIIFTGCGRSGTTYIAKLMRESGVEIGHESVGRDGVAAWQIVGAPNENLPIGLNIRKRIIKGLPIEYMSIKDIFDQASIVFHQIRNPVDVVPSFFTIPETFWMRVAQYMSINLEGSTIEKAISYWYYNNLLTERISDYRYRIEDIDIEIGNIFARLNRQFNSAILDKVSRNVNSRKNKEGYRDVSWIDIRHAIPSMYDNIVNLAIKYGYESEDM